MEEFTPYPWQTPIWQGLMDRKAQQRLPHALLISGLGGIGKRHLASCLAHALLCQSPREDGCACGQCRGCLLLAAGSHPDYLLIEPEEEGKGIGIAQIRRLGEFQSLSSHAGGGRIVQLQPADALNLNAANALLKTLEEPGGNTTLILSSAQPLRLLATIRSRCQQLHLPPATGPAALAWLRTASQDVESYDDSLLQMSGGAPLRALHWARNGELAWRQQRCEELQALEADHYSAPRLAQGWYEIGSERILPWFYGMVLDLLRIKQVPGATALANPALQQALHALADRINLEFLQQYASQLQEWMRALHGQANQQLLLEELLLAWKQRRLAG